MQSLALCGTLQHVGWPWRLLMPAAVRAHLHVRVLLVTTAIDRRGHCLDHILLPLTCFALPSAMGGLVLLLQCCKVACATA